jgi:hypothetical protein
MKISTFMVALLILSGVVRAQSTFSDITDVIKFMENKTYNNSDSGVDLEYGYISSFNTYGIKLTNSQTGNTLYFINCDVKTYGSYADISGMNPTDGSNFKFRLYKTRIVVGIGESKQAIFYVKDS